MNTIYLGLQYNNSMRVIEIGALHIKDARIIKEFHCFINQPVRNLFQYDRCAQNSHCIHPNVLKNSGVPMQTMQQRFENFLREIPGSITLICYCHEEESLQELFPFLLGFNNITYETIELPAWNDREYESWFISARKMKMYSTLGGPCNKLYHAMEYLPTWKLLDKQPSHSQLIRYTNKFRCALNYAYTLAFYQKTIPLYCCDKHFKDLYDNFTYSIKPMYDTHTNIFAELK